MEGAANLTLEDLTVTGGAIGVDLLDNSNSTSVTVRNCTVYGNNSYGIYIGAGDNYAQIVGNTVYGLPTTAAARTIRPTASSAADPTLVFPDPLPSAATPSTTARNYGIDFYAFGPGPNILNNEVYACGTGIAIAGNTSGPANLSDGQRQHGFQQHHRYTCQRQRQRDAERGLRAVRHGDQHPMASTKSWPTPSTTTPSAFPLTPRAARLPDNTVYHNSGDGIEAERKHSRHGQHRLRQCHGHRARLLFPRPREQQPRLRKRQPGHPGQ